jgi:cation transporter-like permease
MRDYLSNRSGSWLFVILTVGIASSISLLGGLGIELTQQKLITIVPLLIALPALNSMVGDYATLIAAHAGDPTERTRTKAELIRAMIPALIISTSFVFILSLLLASRRNFVVDLNFTLKFLAFVVASIMAVVAIMFLITITLDKLLQNHRLNPDDVLIPIVTTISDIFMLGLIALAAWFLF